MKNDPRFIVENDLGEAWRGAIGALLRSGVTEIAPLTVVIDKMTNGVPTQDPKIRSDVDKLLKVKGLRTVETVANTIFPSGLWNDDASDESARLENRNALYNRYANIWPKLERVRANRSGTYFRRMTHFRPKGVDKAVNQLEEVVTKYNNGFRRHSGFQLALFDPTRDHTNSPFLFPCLHQVCFTPTIDGSLSVTGFYATQDIVDRGYGNYVGLCRLGHFVAVQWGMNFSRLTCIAGKAKLGKGITKQDVRALV